MKAGHLDHAVALVAAAKRLKQFIKGVSFYDAVTNVPVRMQLHSPETAVVVPLCKADLHLALTTALDEVLSKLAEYGIEPDSI